MLYYELVNILGFGMHPLLAPNPTFLSAEEISLTLRDVFVYKAGAFTYFFRT